MLETPSPSVCEAPFLKAIRCIAVYNVLKKAIGCPKIDIRSSHP